MDMTSTIVPRSDQLNSDDLIGEPVVVTITQVTAGNAEQPVNVELAEFPGRPYKPSKSMRRVLVQAWGKDASQYAGRRLKLFRNPDITFGKDRVGGIEIEAMSHLDKPLTVSLMVTRGRRKAFTVQPLKEQTPQTAMISKEQWDGITAVVVTGSLEWASGELGRRLNDPREITAQEAETLTNTLKENK